MRFECTTGEETFHIEIDENSSTALINGKEIAFQLTRQNHGRILLRLGTKLYKIDNITSEGQAVSFTLDGKFAEAVVKDEQELLLESLGFETNAVSAEGLLYAPMPGKILELYVDEGDEVHTEDPLIILEAMKMENVLKSPASGTVTSVHIAAGNSVEKNQILLEIEPRG